MDRFPVALHVRAANEQHYELPADFFALTLGPARKYSCCLYPTGEETLAEAENLALEATVERADLKDGQQILELGCGWGSLSLLMAERFPSARITAVSNSASQRRYIEHAAAERRLTNLRVITADMNGFEPGQVYDRVVSVEMFEHMSNWSELLGRIRTWLAADGRLFVHVFTHRSKPYRFDQRRRSRLDRAAFLHRRHHAEPWVDHALSRAFQGRARLALEREPLSEDRARLA